MTIYEKIHRALAGALNGIGEQAVVAGGVDAGRALATETTVTTSDDNCFANPVRADVMVDGRKIAGAAQRRTRHGLLQQGSIQGVAVATGADYIGIGRPITAHLRPAEALAKILEELS
jgi:lipoate-protein ligase A